MMEEQVSELCTGSVVASRKSNELSTVWVNDESADVSSDHRGTGSARPHLEVDEPDVPPAAPGCFPPAHLQGGTVGVGQLSSRRTAQDVVPPVAPQSGRQRICRSELMLTLNYEP